MSWARWKRGFFFVPYARYIYDFLANLQQLRPLQVGLITSPGRHLVSYMMVYPVA
jgi:hypothetical protein